MRGSGPPSNGTQMTLITNAEHAENCLSAVFFSVYSVRFFSVFSVSVDGAMKPEAEQYPSVSCRFLQIVVTTTSQHHAPERRAAPLAQAHTSEMDAGRVAHR